MNPLLFALRRLARQPGFALTALLTLALCIGANLAIFAVVDTVLLKPLPFAQSDRLVTVYNSYPKAGLDRDGASVRDYFTRRGNIPALASISASRSGSEVIGQADGNERREVLRITPEFLDTLGVAPALGRGFTEAEMTPGAPATVLIADAYWRQQFAADPQIVGRSLQISGTPMTVVGVLPADFRYLSSTAQILLPLVSNAEQRGLNALHSEHADMVARLAPGATIAQAQAQIDAHYQVHARGYPWAAEVAAAGFFITVAGLHADHVASIRPTLLLLMGGVLCLLLIGSVNLVNLLLVRASAQGKETSVRRALGAGNRQVLKQVLGETLLLVIVGCALGVLVGAAGLSLLDWLGARALPLAAQAQLTPRVLGVALLGTVLMTVLIAAPVAWFTLRQPLSESLKSGARGGTADAAAQRLRHGFIVAQIALAFVLLAGASALGVSLERAQSQQTGFRPDHVLSARLHLPAAGYPDGAARLDFARRILEQLRAQPGVSAAGFSTNVPMQGRGGFVDNNAMTVVGHVPQPGVSPLLHFRYGVAGDYFAAMGITRKQGRVLETADSSSTSGRACVVDEDFARFYWPDGNALGQRVFEGPDARSEDEAFTVVGVVAAVKQTELTDSRGNGAIYFPYRQLAHDAVYLSVRTGQSPEAFAPMLRAVVRALDPQLALDQLKTMQARIADTLLARRTPAVLAALFSIAALLLAAVGTFGVLSYAVAQRRREVGLRMALGALPAQVSRQFLGVGARMLLLGSALGVGGVWLAGGAMQQLLFDVPRLHWASLAATTVVLAAVTLLACLLPAWRAARISPLTALSER